MKFQVKSIFVKTLLILLATSFVLFGILNFFNGVGNTNILKINNERISVNKFSKFLTEKRGQLFNAKLSNEDLKFLNSKDFVNLSLSEFISNILLENEIKKLSLNESKRAVFEDIYNNENFKGENGKFDLKIFKQILSNNNLTEETYINYLSFYNSRNALIDTLTSQNLVNDNILEELFEEQNKYITANIITIKSKDLVLKSKELTNEEIEEYYNQNKENFKVPETKVISYIDIDLSKYKTEQAKQELSNLEDLVLSAKNIDEIANQYKTTKKSINYNENNKKLPEDFNLEILNYSIGTFSDLVYKDNNIYRIYYLENIIPEYYLSLNNSKNEIVKIIKENNKKLEEAEALNRIYKQLKNNNIEKVALRNSFKFEKNVIVYKTNIKYPENFVDTLYKNIKKVNSFTEPVFNPKNNEYIIGQVKSVKDIADTNTNFMSKIMLKKILNNSYNNSVMQSFDNYLFHTNKIIVNDKLLNSIN